MTMPIDDAIEVLAHAGLRPVAIEQWVAEMHVGYDLVPAAKIYQLAADARAEAAQEAFANQG